MALLIVLGAFALPLEGMGWDFCLIRLMTDLPCPGCGMTRSLIALAHLEPGRALHFHPFGFLFFPIFLFAAAFTFLSKGLKQRLAQALERGERTLMPLYGGLIYSFVGFGVVRMAYCLLANERLT